MMHEPKKSDSPIIARKSTNNVGQPTAELMERRGEAKGNTDQQNTQRTQSRENVSSALDRVRQAARENRNCRFTALLHHVTTDLLREAYLSLKRDAAPGVDGVTWDAYGKDLERNLADLYARAHRGAYRAQPSRRRFIPKADGRQRPLGIAAMEDKILQSAVVKVLNAIYETDFLGFSYGFRPGRGQHDALDALAFGIKVRSVNWILNADIRAFFDTVDHEWLMRFLEHRIGDQRILRLIRKWLKAGVLEDGVITTPGMGTPQGAVISPLLANVYLHYAFDLWAHQWRRKQTNGSVIIVRYADDIVVGIQRRRDAEAFLPRLRERLARFSLTLHAEKTRLIEFGRFARTDRTQREQGKPETFPFLGFTHICTTDEKGKFLLLRRSRSDRMRLALQAIKDQLRRRMHHSIPEQGRWLQRVLRGYFAYHAVPGNIQRLEGFRRRVALLWFKTLRRRSQKDRTTWKKFFSLKQQWLPKAEALHPWPDERFDVRHSRQEPSAGNLHARICAGGVQ